VTAFFIRSKPEDGDVSCTRSLLFQYVRWKKSKKFGSSIIVDPSVKSANTVVFF